MDKARKNRRWFNLRHYWRKCNGEILDVRIHDHAKEIQWDFLGTAFISVPEDEGRIGEEDGQIYPVYTIYIDSIYIAKEKPSPLRPGEMRDMLGITGKEAHWLKDYLMWLNINKTQPERKIVIPHKAHQKAKGYFKLNVGKKVKSHLYLMEKVDKTDDTNITRVNVAASKVKARLDSLAKQKNNKEANPDVRYIVLTIEEV